MIVSELTVLFGNALAIPHLAAPGLLGLVIFSAEQRVREMKRKESAGRIHRANYYLILAGFY